MVMVNSAVKNLIIELNESPIAKEYIKNTLGKDLEDIEPEMLKSVLTELLVEIRNKIDNIEGKIKECYYIPQIVGDILRDDLTRYEKLEKVCLQILELLKEGIF